MKTVWNAELDETLRFHHAAGLTFCEIGDKMGVSRSSIAGRCHRLQLARGKSRPQMDKPRPKKPPTRQLPPEPVVRVLPASNAKGVVAAILATHSRSCRFPIGDPRKPDFQFCGQVTEVGVSYCADHFKIVYYKDPRR